MSDAIFTTHYFKIPFKHYNEPITLVPIGDIHRFADNCHEELYLRILKEIQKTPRCYIIGMGDYDDFMSTSERFSFSHSKFHETTFRSIEDEARKRNERFIKEWEPFKGRIIGLLEGNHHFKFSSGVTTTQIMCEQLGCAYLGGVSFVRLCFDNGHGRSHTLDAYIHHGRGGGRRVSSSVNSVDDLQAVATADIYLMGHDHKKWGVKVDRLELGKTVNDRVELKQKNVVLARTGSFQKGYTENKESWIARGAMRPSNLGVVKIIVTPRRTSRNDGDRSQLELDITV